MKYTVRIAERAQKDIEEAADYIEYALKNPQAADSLLDELDSVRSGLEEMPERYPPARDEILASWGVRFVRIKKYLAFFIVDQAEETVHIIRFLYGKSNWTAILHHDISKQ